MREKLSPRRLALTERLIFRPATAGEFAFNVTFGYEPGGPVREVFCQTLKVGTDLRDLLHQGCILISVALQSGQSMSDLAHIMGEDDAATLPQSMFGLIVRAGVMLDDWLTGQYAFHEEAEARAPQGHDDVPRANVSAGVTNRERPAPSFHCGDSALEPSLGDWPTQMTRLAAEEVAQTLVDRASTAPPPDNVIEIPAFLRRLPDEARV
jgi:hypothetical protein